MTAWRAATQAEIDGRAPEVKLIRGDAVVPEAVRWLWDGWMAAGKLHVLAGAPGTGKTTIALAFAATLSAAGRWPDGTQAVAGSVLIWSGEDDAKDVLVPRLRAMEADMSRVFFVDTVSENGQARPFDPATDLTALEQKVNTIGGIRFLIVDPIVSAVAGDSHKNAEVRRALQPLVTLGQRLDCAVLGISHFTKGTTGREPVERVTGSLAFAALARVVLVAAKLPEDRAEHESARMIARAKSNISPDTGGFGYDLQSDELVEYPGVYASRVLWGSAIDGSARELLAQAEHVNEDGSGQNARDFLLYLLSPGPMRASEVFRDADAHGYSKRQMQRARTALGAKVDKDGMQGGWKWSLPKMPSAREDAEGAGQDGVASSAPSLAAEAYRKRRG